MFTLSVLSFLSGKTDKGWCYANSMLKKSTASKLKSYIYLLAFVLIIILSAVYKYVFKGNGDFSIEAFKSKKTAHITETLETVNDTETAMHSMVSETTAGTTETVALVSVYICGEVNYPGIYEAPKGVILNEIIEDAGGFTESASVNNVNLVYQIEYNMSIYIPSEEEIEEGFSGGDIIRRDGVYVWGSGNSDPSGQASGTGEVKIVNINTATEDELKTLPGIGDVTAKAIIDYRNSTPFETIEDIKKVTGIGDSKFNRIKDYICV